MSHELQHALSVFVGLISRKCSGCSGLTNGSKMESIEEMMKMDKEKLVSRIDKVEVRVILISLLQCQSVVVVALCYATVPI